MRTISAIWSSCMRTKSSIEDLFATTEFIVATVPVEGGIMLLLLIATAVSSVCLSSMISSQPMGTRESTLNSLKMKHQTNCFRNIQSRIFTLIPVCNGSNRDCLGIMPGAFRTEPLAGSKGTLAINGFAKGINDPAKTLNAERDVDDGTSPLDDIALGRENIQEGLGNRAFVFAPFQS